MNVVPSEGKILVRFDLLKLGRLGGSGRIGRSVVRIGSELPRGASVGFAVYEHRVVRDNFGGIAFLPLAILPGARLDGTGDAKSGTLFEIPGNELRRLPPCDYTDEIGLLPICQKDSN